MTNEHRVGASFSEAFRAACMTVAIVFFLFAGTCSADPLSQTGKPLAFPGQWQRLTGEQRERLFTDLNGLTTQGHVYISGCSTPDCVQLNQDLRKFFANRLHWTVLPPAIQTGKDSRSGLLVSSVPGPVADVATKVAAAFNKAGLPTTYESIPNSGSIDPFFYVAIGPKD